MRYQHLEWNFYFQNNAVWCQKYQGYKKNLFKFHSGPQLYKHKLGKEVTCRVD